MPLISPYAMITPCVLACCVVLDHRGTQEVRKMDLRRTKEAALLAYSDAHFAGLVAVTTVPSYETRLGTTVAGFGEDPSRTAALLSLLV